MVAVGTLRAVLEHDLRSSLTICALALAVLPGCGGGLQGASARAIGGACHPSDVYVFSHDRDHWTATCRGTRYDCVRSGRGASCAPERRADPVVEERRAGPGTIERATEDGAVTVRATMRAGDFEIRIAGSPARDPSLVVWTLHATRPIDDFETCPLAVMVDGVVTRWPVARTERRELHVALRIDDIRTLVAAQSIDGRVCTEPWSIEAGQLQVIAQFVAAFDEEVRWAASPAPAP